MKIFRITAFVLLISWMILIFSLSGQTAEVSSQTSGGVIELAVKLFYPDFDKLTQSEKDAVIAPYQFFVRKAAHFSAYALLGVLAFLSIVTYSKIPFRVRCISSLAFCLLYSVSDEIHQYFVPGRSCELRDVFIDFCGSALAVLIMWGLFKSQKIFRRWSV